jgi:maltooligosyltrehalose trehalohydrolase
MKHAELVTPRPSGQAPTRSAASQFPAFGAIPVQNGTRFRVLAPAARELTLVIDAGAAVGSYAMRRGGDGVFELVLPETRGGDTYAYRLDGGELRPDPASRFQPEGVHGHSQIVDPSTFRWRHAAFTPVEPSRLVVYELHVGTFTREGTFRAAAGRLPALRDLGVTAVELMPLADFAGNRNWGYDGVCLFAPSRAYGTPDDLRTFVDEAHRLGLSVILDAVYNHLGPEGAYLNEFNPDHLTDRHSTPWGGAVNLDGPGSDLVRRFLIDNAVHWIREYRFDGLRLDATHTLIDESSSSPDRHFVRELADHARQASPHAIVIHAEDHRNLTDLVEPHGWALDGVWADDFHHVVRRMVAGDAHGYYCDFNGTADELARTIRQGWLFTGQHSQHLHEQRGTDPSRVPMQRFVVCVQNHDQIGNRAMGDRLHHAVDAPTWRAVSALLLTAPTTPLLFMGQEWAASTPFRYFTDLEPGLGRLVTEGRRREFKDFPEFADPASRDRIPDPQALETFQSSQLRWEERSRPEHATILALYRALLTLRRDHAAFGASDALTGHACALDPVTIAICRPAADGAYWIVARLKGAGVVDLTASGAPHALATVLTTEDPEFAVDPQRPSLDGRRIRFQRPSAVILKEHEPNGADGRTPAR